MRYGDLWNELHRLFRGLMRCIAGVPKSTTFNAVLVRLGMLPLHYSLALKAMCEFFRIHSAEVGTSMADLNTLFDSESQEWNETLFLAAAQRNIRYFQQFIEEPLL